MERHSDIETPRQRQRKRFWGNVPRAVSSRIGQKIWGEIVYISQNIGRRAWGLDILVLSCIKLVEKYIAYNILIKYENERMYRK